MYRPSGAVNGWEWLLSSPDRMPPALLCRGLTMLSPSRAISTLNSQL